MNYLEVVRKAKKGELSAKDLNEVVVALAENEKAQDKKIYQNEHDMICVKEEYPLLPPEADDLSTAVKRKGVEVMGGKKSKAYQDQDLRRKVYRDIYSEIKRQYDLIDEKGAQLSYKKLKRKYLKGAFIVVDNYVAPIALQNEIESLNELDEDM